MKVLALSDGLYDYMTATVVLGLVRLLGNNAYFYPRLPYLESAWCEENSAMLGTFWGRGFTMTAHLDRDYSLPREQVTSLLEQGHFDLVIYTRAWGSLPFFNLVLQRYNRDQVVFIDGEDHQSLKLPLTSLGSYFKRELSVYHPKIMPINFGLPDGLVRDPISRPSRRIATVDPRDRSTYIFSTQDTYYDDYQNSYYAITIKKGGWDCLRHYEIMGMGCVPLFLDIRDCPVFTLYDFPKEDFINALELYKIASYPEHEQRYDLIRRKIHSYMRSNLTTSSVVARVLDRHSSFVQRGFWS